MIQRQNHENHEILRISTHNRETNENLSIHVKITKNKQNSKKSIPEL